MARGLLYITAPLLRRGKPRPRAGMFPAKYRRVPMLLKPQQGGQQYFSDFLTRRANEDILDSQRQQNRGAAFGGLGFMSDNYSTEAANATDEDQFRVQQQSEGLHPRLPQMDVHQMLHGATPAAVEGEMRQLQAMDGFQTQRSFNERQWYDEELQRRNEESKRQRQTGGGSTDGGESAQQEPSDNSETVSELPERILGDDYFQSRYGFSLLRREREAQAAAAAPQVPQHLQGHPAAAQVLAKEYHTGTSSSTTGGLTAYSQLDMWAELPKYHREMIFLYLISRRRNTYAVAYDYYGRRFLHPYTAGNRGLKGGDRGFRGDGSTDNGHQVTSAYLNDLIPKIRESRAEAGLPPLKRGDKVDVVLRVMGFYNGRQGAVRAVQDRSAEFNVRYVEDITPFPLNGPKMPKGVFR